MAEKHNIYGYNPSLPAAIIFIILFSVTTAYHGYQLTKSRCWYFIPFVIGGIFQVIGYICRAASHDNFYGIPLYAMQTLFILLAPPLYAASIYMILGRTVTYLHAEHLSLVPVKWMTKIFVGGDVFSFLLQCSGGGLMASAGSMRETGSNITIGGLVVQLLFFGFFVVVTTVFHFRILRQPTSRSQSDRDQTRGGGFKQRNWFTILVGLYIVSFLILVRSVFRLVEYKEGYDGYTMTHEVFMYIFDGVLMLIAMAVMNVYHPAEILGNGKGENQEYLGATQLE
ncbi:RTA-like protein [Penicillium coprophilum]|uniref:RTA-like protein n=1 Tax=Penicillium coprophilum TaxID=36646 RepID=UPI0023915DB6|nr:RTA-like protein [Penicillium coprophilum]KAJ5162636.1 RTA-like protein [Penicillium coprophilum]